MEVCLPTDLNREGALKSALELELEGERLRPLACFLFPTSLRHAITSKLRVLWLCLAGLSEQATCVTV
jgi:hypothetical protein